MNSPGLGVPLAINPPSTLKPQLVWRRMFARIFDCTLVAAGGTSLAAVNFPRADPDISSILSVMVALLVSIPIEAWILSQWGNSPGKALLDIQILNPDGNKLDYHQALKRSALVFWFGLGAVINFNIAALHNASLTLTRTALPWDRMMGLEPSAKGEKTPWIGAIMALLIFAVLLFFSP